MHMGAVVTFRPRGKVDGGKLATLLAQRAAKIPKLRQLARTALFPPGAASWAEDPEFDATRHIHLHRASGLYEPDPLAEHASRWIAQPLDTSKPLWDLHVVTSLPDNRFALLLKLHHALTDGAGAFAIAAGLLDELAIAATRTPVTPAQTPSRSTLESLKDTLTSTWAQAGEAATIASSVLRAARPYPTSPITAPSTKDRSVGFVRLAVSGEDRRGLYADICEAISGTGTNIRSAELASKDGVVFGSVLVEVENNTHLHKVLKAVRKVKGVTEIARRDSSGPAEVVVG